MSIQQYRCKKHPKLTRRASHPYKLVQYMWYQGTIKEQIIYKHIIPKCPVCGEYMEIYHDSEKGNKVKGGFYKTLDKNFKKILKGYLLNEK